MTHSLKNIRLLGLFAFLFILSGSNMLAAPGNNLGNQSAPSGNDSGNLMATSGNDSNTEESKTAKVIIYRPGSYFGAAIRIRLKVGELDRVRIKNRTRTELEVPAGNADFNIKFRRKASFSMDLEPGKTYYFRGAVLPGWTIGRGQLIEVSEEQGERDLKKYKFRGDRKRRG